MENAAKFPHPPIVKCSLYNAATGLYDRARKETATAEMPFYWDDERSLWVKNPLWILSHPGITTAKEPFR